MIDGRPKYFEDSTGRGDDGAIVPSREFEHADRGFPGAQYRVRLQVAGKWRTVVWERVSQGSPPTSLAARPPFSGAGRSGASRYFVTGSFNYWGFQEMKSASSEGTFRTEVTVTRPGGADFQIVRNEDWMQVMYPSYDGAPGGDEEILGPDDESMGTSWHIAGKPGETFSIEFQRLADSSGSGQMKVCWSSLGSRSMSKHQLEEAAQVKYFLISSLDGFRSRKEMSRLADGDFAHEVVLGREAEVQFQVLRDGNFAEVLHPNKEDANPHVEHMLVGPAPWSPLCWTIGKDPADETSTGKAYTVKLIMGRNGIPRTITWEAS
jgi:hypothetical protein